MEPVNVDRALAEWEESRRASLKKDPIWTLRCYREALFLAELARRDVDSARELASRVSTCDQLLRSVTSISANLAEGYGRSTALDRIKFFNYAVCSAREAVTWYQSFFLRSDDSRADDRFERLSRVRAMLFALIKNQREKTTRTFETW
jgi:four helix bundle protein